MHTIDLLRCLFYRTGSKTGRRRCSCIHVGKQPHYFIQGQSSKSLPFHNRKIKKNTVFLDIASTLNINVIFILKIFSVIQLQLSAFSPHPSTQPHLPPLPPPSPLILSMCPLQQFLKTPLPTVPTPQPPDYCQIVLNFNVIFIYLFTFIF